MSACAPGLGKMEKWGIGMANNCCMCGSFPSTSSSEQQQQQKHPVCGRMSHHCGADLYFLKRLMAWAYFHITFEIASCTLFIYNWCVNDKSFTISK